MKTIKIITYNIWGLPWPFSKDLRSRTAKIIAFLTKEKPDVICLQEVWLKTTLRTLKKALEKKGYHCTTLKRKTVFNASGLVTFTKQKPLKTTFVSFAKTLPLFHERIAQKGFLVTKINWKGKKIDIINAHLFARYNKAQDRFLHHQLTRLKNYLQEKDNYVLAGDFNATAQEFASWKPKEAVYTAPDKPTMYEKNPYENKLSSDYHSKNEAIDHVAAKFSQHKKIEIYNHVPNPIFFSDHMAVISTVSFS